jgi:hypothetical protein
LRPPNNTHVATRKSYTVSRFQDKRKAPAVSEAWSTEGLRKSAR